MTNSMGPPDSYRIDSFRPSVEMVLTNIQKQLATLTERVDDMIRSANDNPALRDIRQELRDHVSEEREWQTRIEKDLSTALGKFATLDSLSSSVKEHEDIVQKTKGALLLGKLLWVVLGIVLGILGWVVMHVSDLSATVNAVNRNHAPVENALPYQPPLAPVVHAPASSTVP